VAGNIVGAWVLTLPAAATFGAITYGICNLFGSGALGPVVITAVLVAVLGAALGLRLQRVAPAPAAP
jgi:phosphate/sulfate permease